VIINIDTLLMGFALMAVLGGMLVAVGLRFVRPSPLSLVRGCPEQRRSSENQRASTPAVNPQLAPQTK
jgi:hypothetical protein